MLSESEQRLRSLVEETGVGVTIIDLTGAFTYVNGALAELLGYSIGEVLGRLVRESHPAQFSPNPVTYSQAIGEIMSFGLWMRREGYRESTIQPCIRALKAIARRTD